MSVSTLFNPSCDYNLYCNTITAAGGFITPGSVTISRDLVVLGNEAVNGALSLGQTTSGTGLLTVQGSTGAIIAIGNSGNNFYLNYDAPASTLSLLQSGTATGSPFNVNLNGGTMIVSGNIQLPTALTGIYFGTLASNYLNFYEHQSPSVTFSGPWATNQTSICEFTRVGNMITLTFSTVSSTIAIATVITSSVVLTDFRPNQTVDAIIPVSNATGLAQGYITITSAGVITISVGFGSAFSGIGFAGFPTFSINYSL